MKEYLDLKRKPFFVTMKTILFFAPIGIITNNIYLCLYGDYHFTLKLADVHVNQAIVSFLVFSAISFSAFWIERELLPAILILMDKRFDVESKSFIRSQKILIPFFEKLYSTNPFVRIESIGNKKLFKFRVCSDLMYFPIMLILWLVAVNSFFTYIIIPFILIIAYYMVAMKTNNISVVILKRYVNRFEKK